MVAPHSEWLWKLPTDLVRYQCLIQTFDFDSIGSQLPPQIYCDLMTGTLPGRNRIARWRWLPILSKSNVCIRHWYLTKSVGASTATQSGVPPFQNHRDLYDTIDSNPLGNTPWESFSLRFNGYQPEGHVSSWMDTDYNSGFVIHADLFITSSQTQISRRVWLHTLSRARYQWKSSLS